MGINITTDERGVKVYRNDKYDKPSYAIKINRKEGDEWLSVFQPVRFAGGADIPNKTIIKIHEAFPTISSWVKDNEQHVRLIWMIMDYSYEGMKDKPEKSFLEMPEMPDSFSEAEDEIPF